MSHRAENRIRLISITEGNLRNHHLYITGHHDFFPEECYGPSDARKGVGCKLRLLVEGLPDAVETDVAKAKGNGRPRNFFRKRDWVGDFYRIHQLSAGEVVAIERQDSFTYRVCPFRNGDQKSQAAKRHNQDEQAVLIADATQPVEENARSDFGDTAFTRNRQEPLHRPVEIFLPEGSDLA